MWDELLQSMVFGKEVEYRNEKYTIVHTLEGDYQLAVKTYDKLPAQTYVIKIKV